MEAVDYSEDENRHPLLPMSKSDHPVTAAIRFLRENTIPFEPHQYGYEDHGGTRVAATALAIPERAVVRTLVMETELRKPLLVVMHGDCEVSTKQLSRRPGVKQVVPCDPAIATRHTGYDVGGTSPWGTLKQLPVYVEATIFDLPRVSINGGKRGFLVGIDPRHLRTVLEVTEVSVAIQRVA